MKKRIFAAILALLMLVLTACGSGTGNTPAPTPSATPAASPSAPAESRPVETPPVASQPVETPSPTPEPTPTLKNEVSPAASYLVRNLDRDEIFALKDADLLTLRAKLSTLGDVLAYLDAYHAPMYSAINMDDGGGALVVSDFLDCITRKENPCSSTAAYTCLAAYFLSDDYEDMGYVLAGVCDTETMTQQVVPWLLSALYLPTDEGYLILTPAYYSTTKNNNNCVLAGLQEVVVPTLSNLEKSLVPLNIGTGKHIQDIYIAPPGQTDLIFLPNSFGLFELAAGTADHVYIANAADRAAWAETVRLDRVEQAWAALDSNWNTYGLPSSQAPTMTRQEAEALYGKDLETVAAAVKTIGDCIYYFAGAGYECSGGDLQIPTSTSLVWHFNYAPRQALINNFGCCGTISGLTARLLEDDLDAVGIIGITFGLDEGGGHVISWAKNGDEYYVFDMINLISTNYQQWGFLFTSGQSIQEAAGLWSQASNWTERLMYAYQSFDGDAPVGWDWDNSNISYLPDKYKDTAIILLETPEEGYVYQWVTIDDDTWARINAIRMQD